MVTILSLVILILSVIVHEVAHGYAANSLGDPTARLAGRLTLNPIPHIDFMGSIVLPALLVFTGSPILFGGAKPVPYNPYNLRDQRWGEALVAVAGPATNVLIAIFFGLLIRLGVSGSSDVLLSLFVTATYTNLVLALYNLIPVPPLDGSKVLRSLLPLRARMAFGGFERSVYAFGPFGLIAIGLLAIYLLWPFLSGFVQWLFVLITGLTF